MKKISMKKTADFIGSTERILYEWKKQNKKKSLYLGARIATYLLQKNEVEYKRLKEAIEELKGCCIKEEKLQPFIDFINAIEQFKDELRENK